MLGDPVYGDTSAPPNEPSMTYARAEFQDAQSSLSSETLKPSVLCLVFSAKEMS